MFKRVEVDGFYHFYQSITYCNMEENEGKRRMLEIRHFSHSEHALRFAYGSIYKCNGCGEFGNGFKYECRPCNFDLHESCARAPKSTRHSCHPQHLLKFREKPFSAHIECDVCREKIEGFVYECRGCDIDLHPSCVKLPHMLRHALHPHHMLQLVPSHSTGHGHGHVCNVCGEAFTSQGMRYRCCEGSTPCGFMLHISCAKLPVDPLEEMRMQSISPLEVPRAPMSTSSFHEVERVRMLSILPLEVRRGYMSTSAAFSGASSSLGTAARSRNGSELFVDTGTAAEAKHSMDDLQKVFNCSGTYFDE